MYPIDQQAMSPEMIARIKQAGVIAVIVLDKLQDAVPLSKALLAGGVNAIELTLRTPVALEGAKIIKQEVPEIMVGLGTVLTVQQVKAATEIGVDFAVSPGCNPRILSAANDNGLSFAPGIATPTDIEIALEAGCRLLKYFPAKTLGGLEHLTNMAAPYQYLKLSFIPLGGVNMSNASEYLNSPLIGAIGGSWIANRSLIQANNWKKITENSLEIRETIRNIL